MAREGKIPAVKIGLGKNNKVIIRDLYNQQLIKKISGIKMVSNKDLRQIRSPLDRLFEKNK